MTIHTARLTPEQAADILADERYIIATREEIKALTARADDAEKQYLQLLTEHSATFTELGCVRDDLHAAQSTAAGLRRALEEVLASAVPHPVEHPTMTAAWKVGHVALAASPHEHERRIKAEGAAEWLTGYLRGLSAGNPGAPGSMVAILEEELKRLKEAANG